MESKKINQLATNVAPQTSDLTIIGDPITGVSKKITLLQIADLFATTGTVTSVAVTETGNALTITGSPITSAGTINIGFAGAASQYVRGDGALADFPTSTGGGSSVSYYLNSSVSQGTIGGNAYRQLSKTPVIGAGTDITISANGYVANYITDANDPALLEVPGGNFNCEFYFSVNSNNHNPYVYAELYKYDGTTFTLLGSSQSIPEYLTNGTTLSAYYFAIPVATAALTITDRLAIRIYVNVDTRTITLHTENSHLCQVVTTFSKGLTSLNNLTRQVQFLATGTSGTDFNISSSTATHTFNLPVASATNTGKLSSTDWSTFNGKQAALSFTAPLINTSNTISIPVATASVDGYLDNADWTIFNNKQSAITLTTTGTSGAATLIGATLNIPNYGSALSSYVTLGTTQTITGSKFFDGEVVFNNGVFHNSTTFNYGNNVFYHSATLGFVSGATTIVGVANGVKFGLPSTASTQFTFNNTVGLVYTFPGTSGTIALTSDLHNPVTIGTANGLSLSTQVLSLALASTSATGALSSTDWNTFNGKQNALTNPITGTGTRTTTYLPLFSGTNTISNSTISEGAETGVFIANSLSVQNPLTVTSYVTADAFIPTNSTVPTNGMYRSATNTLAFATNSTNRLTIGSTGAATFSSTLQSGSITIKDGGNNGQGTLNLGSTNGYFIQGGADYTAINFYTNASERMRITSGGFVGIGTNVPDAIFHVAKTGTGGLGGQIVIDNNANDTVGNTAELSFLTTNGASGTGIRNARIQAVCDNAGNGATNLQFFTWSGATDAERMRITSGGNVLIGTTSDVGDKLVSNGGVRIMSPSNNAYYRTIYASTDGNFYFYNGTNQGYINSAGSFVNASDIRLKKDIIDIKYGLADLLKIKPRSYNRVDVEGEYIGFIAQEIRAIIPEVVSGDEEKQLGVDYGSLVALAVKAIQELKAEIDELKNK
jgi:hypothetical protein